MVTHRMPSLWLSTILLFSIDRTQADLPTCGQPALSCPSGELTVTGGSATCAEKVPWQATFFLKQEVDEGIDADPFCGGSLITDRHILTAAHCFWFNDPVVQQPCPRDCVALRNCPNGCSRKLPDEVLVFLGMSYTDDYADDIARRKDVRDIFLHPGYDRSSHKNEGILKGNDMAVVLLSIPVSLFTSTIKQVCLPDPVQHTNLIDPDKKVAINGFGFTHGREFRYASILQTAGVKIANLSVCQEIWGERVNELCVAADPARVVCANKGDSGGGLIGTGSDGRSVVIGVISFGDVSCRRPGVATNVIRNLEWINTVSETGYRDGNAYYEVDVHIGGVFRDIFEGELVNGTWSGKVLEGKREGYGRMLWDNGASYYGKFKSDLKEDRNATFQWRNGDIYVGPFVAGFRNGNGSYTWGEETKWQGDRVVGEFQDGQPNGYGEKTFGKKSRYHGHLYKGQFRFGSFHGYGEYFWPNGVTYKGNYLNNNRHGQGTYNDPRRGTYRGDFKHGNIEGSGIYTWTTGVKFIGFFKANKRSGEGTLTWPDGRIFKGRFQDHRVVIGADPLETAEGVMTFPDGRMVNQKWEKRIQIF